jgi:hypothetical protein
MLSMVPITINGVEYQLQFQHGDVPRIEEKLGAGLPYLFIRERMSIRYARVFMLYALKKEEKDGSLTRVLPITEDGLNQAEDLVRDFTKDKTMGAIFDLFTLYIRALTASGWFTEVKPEDLKTPAPEVDPSKKLVKTG